MSSISQDKIVTSVNISPIIIKDTDIENISDTIIEEKKDNNLTSHTYLNEKENWRAKNKSPKNRSKYLTICPYVESIHAKPKENVQKMRFFYLECKAKIELF